MTPHTIRFVGTGTGVVTVPTAGTYSVEASPTEDSGVCPPTMNLKGPLGLSDGATIPEKGDAASRSHLLLDGNWAIETSAGCHWILVLTPLFGRGGGASNF